MQEKNDIIKYACVLYVLWCDWYHMEKCKKIFAKYRLSFFFVYSNREATVVKCKTHVHSHCFCSLNLLFCSVVVAVGVVVS